MLKDLNKIGFEKVHEDLNKIGFEKVHEDDQYMDYNTEFLVGETQTGFVAQLSYDKLAPKESYISIGMNSGDGIDLSWTWHLGDPKNYYLFTPPQAMSGFKVEDGEQYALFATAIIQAQEILKENIK